MLRVVRAVAGGIILVVAAGPAMAQPYGYGQQAPAYGSPPEGAYGPPPPAYGPPPPQPVYREQPGSRCEASFDGEYRRHRFVCPMRIAKPVGAPCR